MKRGIRLAIGLLAVSSLSVFGLSATSSQEATPTPPFIYDIPEGLDIKALSTSPDISMANDTPFSISIDRYTYDPGVSFEIQYHGPVLYYVEAGELAVTNSNDLRLEFSYTTSDPNDAAISLGSGPGKETILQPGYAVFAEDGRLGPTRNAGSGKLVVLAMLVVPTSGGLTWGITGDPNATPMNEVEIPSS